MADERGKERYHDAARAPASYYAIFALPIAITAVTALAGRTPIAVPIVSALVLGAVAVAFSVLRITVSTGEVLVRHGPVGPRIPIASIERCETVDHDAGQDGGWGTRYGRDGSIVFTTPGCPGRAVRITYRRGKRSAIVVIASRDPERLAAAIGEARGG